jgi:hypothetical protein
MTAMRHYFVYPIVDRVDHSQIRSHSNALVSGAREGLWHLMARSSSRERLSFATETNEASTGRSARQHPQVLIERLTTILARGSGPSSGVAQLGMMRAAAARIVSGQ